MRHTPLHLHEELLLLALHDTKGTLGGAHTSIGLGGAIAAELLLRERIRIDESRRWRKLVEVRDIRRTEDAILNECLKRIRDAKRRASIQTWITRFSSTKKLHHRVAEELCARRILRADEQEILLIFKRRVFPEIDPGPEREIIERLRTAIFSDDREVEPRTVVLAALAHAVGLLNPTFGRRELRPRKQRLKSLVKGDVIGKATSDAVEAAQAAVAAAAVMPAIIAASTSSNSG
jgi:hypothetical protein